MSQKQNTKAKPSSKKKGATQEKFEKHVKDVELKPELLQSMIKEVPKMTVITPNQIAVKYNLRLSEAKKALIEMAGKGMIKPVAGSRRLKIYTASKTD